MAYKAAQMLGMDCGFTLPLIVAYLGIADVEGLIYRLTVIKQYRKPDET